MVLSECVFCPSLGVLAEVVSGELGRLPEEGAELQKEAARVSQQSDTRKPHVAVGGRSLVTLLGMQYLPSELPLTSLKW